MANGDIRDHHQPTADRPSEAACKVAEKCVSEAYERKPHAGNASGAERDKAGHPPTTSDLLQANHALREDADTKLKAFGLSAADAKPQLDEQEKRHADNIKSLTPAELTQVGKLADAVKAEKFEKVASLLEGIPPNRLEAVTESGLTSQLKNMNSSVTSSFVPSEHQGYGPSVDIETPDARHYFNREANGKWSQSFAPRWD